MGRIKRYRTALQRHHRSKGHGIHSPFAYRFVRFVLCEKSPYYSYEELGELRKAVVDTLRDVKNHPRVVSFKGLKMLFRVVNHFNQPCIMQVGTSYGLTTATMLNVNSTSRVWLYDPHLETYNVTARVLMPYIERVQCYNRLDVAVADYHDSVPEGAFPLVLVNSIPQESDLEEIETWLASMLESDCVIMMRNLHRSNAMKHLWQHLKQNMTHGQSFTNEKTAFIVTNKKLNLQHFFLWF